MEPAAIQILTGLGLPGLVIFYLARELKLARQAQAVLEEQWRADLKAHNAEMRQTVTAVHETVSALNGMRTRS